MAVHVSLHDVSPAWEPEVELALERAHAHGVRPALLVCRTSTPKTGWRYRYRVLPRLTALRTLRLSLRVLVTACLASRTGVAADADPRVPVYDVPLGCGPASAFVDGVKRRAVRAASAEGRSFHVNVEALAGGFRGRVRVRRSGFEDAERTVEAPTCAEVLTALSLVAALSLEAAERPEAEETAAVPPVPPTVEQAPEERARRPPPEQAEAGASPPGASRFAIGAHAAAQAGVSPDLLFTVPIFAELAFAPRLATRALRARFAPLLRGTFVRGTNHAHGEHGDASFTWTVGEIDACLIAIEIAPATLSPCPRLELGIVNAEGERLVPARAEARTWAALALPVRLRLALGRLFFVEIEAGPRVPILRDRFFFQPDATVFVAPFIAWSAGTGLGLAIP